MATLQSLATGTGFDFVLDTSSSFAKEKPAKPEFTTAVVDVVDDPDGADEASLFAGMSTNVYGENSFFKADESFMSTENAIYFDSSLCSDCKGCQVACKCWNNLPSPMGVNESQNKATAANPYIGNYQNPADLNGDTRLIMRCNELDNPDSQKGVGLIFTRRSCQHCTDAGCVRVCPPGALYHDETTGFVAVDESKCIACHYCETACPYDVPRYYGERGIIDKCDGCIDRVRQGMKPACVTTCQPGALDYGPRSVMLDRAYKRVAVLKQRGFANAAVNGGQDQMGGLHVISVLKYGFEAHEVPEKPALSPIVFLSEIAKPLSAIGIAAVVGALGISFINGRGYDTGDLKYDENTGVQTKHGEEIAVFPPEEVRESAITEPVHPVSRRFTGEDKKGGK